MTKWELSSEDGFGKLIEGLQMAFDAATRVTFGGAHAN
jgi:hypothetical protein